MRLPTSALAVLLALASAGCAERSGAPIEAGTMLVARDEQGRNATLRVESVVRDLRDEDGDVFLYELSVREESGVSHPFCLPDADGRMLAIPLAGHWDARRNHVESDAITFACTNGALAKCVLRGYKPWKTVNGVRLADHHQACVHMTLADYCGDGTPHTREGTRIDIWDRLGIQTRETEPGMRFEAAWGPEGAVYLSKPRFGEPLQEIAAACPDRLHTALDTPALDAEAIVSRWPEALLFTESHEQTERP